MGSWTHRTCPLNPSQTGHADSNPLPGQALGSFEQSRNSPRKGTGDADKGLC